MNYAYQALTGADIARFRQLMTVFAEAFEDAESYQGKLPSDAYLEAFLEKEHVIALAALDGERVAGGLVAYELEKFERERKEIYIYDLAVLKAHRRKGIATGLVNTLRRIAGERGAYVIFVQADAGDEPAIEFYESLGTREDVLHFDIDVK